MVDELPTQLTQPGAPRVHYEGMLRKFRASHISLTPVVSQVTIERAISYKKLNAAYKVSPSTLHQSQSLMEQTAQSPELNNNKHNTLKRMQFDRQISVMKHLRPL